MFCRKRFNRLRWYARAKKIPFEITLDDIKEILFPLEDLGHSYKIERVDRTGPFRADNLMARRWALANKDVVKEVEGLRTADPAAVRAALERVLTKKAKRAFRGTEYENEWSIDDLMHIYESQGGSCPFSMVKFALTRIRSPESMEIVKKNRDAPWSKGNIVLVARMLKPIVDTWGIKPYLKLVRTISRRKKKEVARGPQA